MSEVESGRKGESFALFSEGKNVIATKKKKKKKKRRKSDTFDGGRKELGEILSILPRREHF